MKVHNTHFFNCISMKITIQGKEFRTRTKLFKYKIMIDPAHCQEEAEIMKDLILQYIF